MNIHHQLAAIARKRAAVGPDVTAPTLVSATISASGVQLVLQFSEDVEAGTDAPSVGLVLNTDGAAVAVVLNSILGSSISFTLDATVLAVDTLTLDYTQPGDGIQDASGNLLATFSAFAINNDSTQSGAVNLVLNPGFESYTGVQDDNNGDTFTSWTLDNYGACIIQSTSTSHSGTAAVKITHDGTNSYPGLLQDGIVVTPGANLTLKFWTRGSADAGDLVYVLYDLTNAAPIVADTHTGITSATYQEVTIPFTIPGGCVSLRVYFYCDTGISTSGVYVDDVSVQ